MSEEAMSMRRRLLVCAMVLSGLAVDVAAQDERGFWDESAEATARAEELLQQMSLDDKINMMHGEVNFLFGFYNAPIDALGIPALTMADGPAGVSVANPDVNAGRSTQLPSPLALAATWSPELAERYGALMGAEAHHTGHNVILGPVLDIARVSQWGRVFETYGEDPLLAGTLGAANIRGIQSIAGVISAPKHYLAYAQEVNRLSGGNVVIDERTLQEIYARPFAIALRDAHPGAVMCSFNRINDVYACENELILTDVLKRQLDFQGWVMTDYNSIHSAVPSVLAGLDQDMPGNTTPDAGPGDCFFCGPLLEAVASDEVPQSRIDDAVLRILRPMFALGLFDQPPVIAPLPEAEHGAEALAIAEQSIVLLKNENAVLPLGENISSIAVIGADADTVVAGGGSALVEPTYAVSPLEAIRSRAPRGVTVEHRPGADPVTSVAMLGGLTSTPSDFLSPPDGQGRGLRAEYFLNPDFQGQPELDRIDPYVGIHGGILIFAGTNAQSPHFPEYPETLNQDISIRWTGQLTAPVAGVYEFALTTTGSGSLFVDEELVVAAASDRPGGLAEFDDLMTTHARIELQAGPHEVRVEFAMRGPQNSDSGPKFKLGWLPPQGVVAPQAVAAAELARRSDVAVVFVRDYAGEGADRSILNLPNDQGELIRQVAAANPRTIVVMTTSGAVQTSTWDTAVPAVLHAWYGGQEQGAAIARVLFGDVNPSGKLPITIPTNEASTPISGGEQYPGAGLNQQFAEGILVGYRGYEQLGIRPSYAFGHGLSYTTFDYSDLRITGGAPPTSGSGGAGTPTPLEATVTVRNTGAVAGTETVQVYAGKLPTETPTAPKSLAGWGKVTLAPGASQEITIQLDPQSLSYWDADTWQTPTGEVPIYVGSSSSDIRLEGVGHAAPLPAAPSAAPDKRQRRADQRRDVPSLRSIRDQ